MIVCIAEKPSVAKDIAGILGAHQRHITKGVGYLEGNGYAITWTFGHLCTLKEPQDYHPAWRQWSLSALPMIPERFGIKPIDIENYKQQLAVIEELLSRATLVINCGDAGQEGELIQRWVLQKCGCRVPVKRLWISSLTDESIREGFDNLKEDTQFQSLYEAGLARAIGDWLLGMNATRLFTTRFASGKGQILSIGRVQTPTLALIVQRHYEIANFVPETYWELKTSYRDTVFSADKGKYSQRSKAEQALQTILDHPLTISDTKKKEGKEAPPKLFDLTGLQVACNRKFGMSAEETLKTIQRLYELKLTTYPRVDTTYLSDDLYPRVRTILTGLVGYRDLTLPLLSEKTLRKSKKVFDNTKVTDHHAIIPTGQPVHNLSLSEQRVFDLIARHFIAAFYPDCKVSTTTVLAEVNGVKFKASGKEILEAGWRIVFARAEEQTAETPEEGADSSDTETSKTEERVLPSFAKGESGPHTPEIKERHTQPPKPYTEATLLRAMETAGKLVEHEELREAMKENGIGRPSTRANIIETLFKRNYIQKEKRSQLQPTPTGIQLIETIDYELLKSAELTGQWEYKLRQIEHGQLEASVFVDELKQMVQDLVRSVLAPDSSPKASPSTNTPSTPLPHCPRCGSGRLLRGKTAYGCSAYQEGCTFRLPFAEYGDSLSAEELNAIIQEAEKPASLFD